MISSRPVTDPPSPRPGRAPRAARPGRRRRVAAAWVALVLLVPAGCTLRLETPPPTIPPASPAEQVRQAMAVQAAGLADRAQGCLDAGTDADGVAWDSAARSALEAVADHARAHVKALGGVWQAYPSATATPADGAGSGRGDATGSDGGQESGTADDAATTGGQDTGEGTDTTTDTDTDTDTTTGTDTTTADDAAGRDPVTGTDTTTGDEAATGSTDGQESGSEDGTTTGSSPAAGDTPQEAGGATSTASCDPAALAQDLVAAAAQAVRTSVDSDRPDMSRLAGAMGVSRYSDAAMLAAALPAVGELDVPAAPLSLAAAPKAGSASFVVPAVYDEDALGHAMEFAAARLTGRAATSMAARAERHRRMADALADVNGLTGTDADPRLGAYEMPAGDHRAGELTAFVTRTEAALAGPYCSLAPAVAPAAREKVLGACTYYLIAQRRLGEQTPDLPGLQAG